MRSLVLVVASGCASWLPHRDEVVPPVPPATPSAIEGINSPYDDFNSADMSNAYKTAIVFSTNRGSEGKNYDLYEAIIDLDGSGDHVGPVVVGDVVPFMPELMSDGDERGPIELDKDYAPLGSRGRFVFASTRAGGKGGLDLYAAEICTSCDRRLSFRALEALSSEGDDAYLTYSPLANQLLLASNAAAGAPLDIYAATWDPRDTIDSLPRKREVLHELSSDADDSAPFVYFTDAERENGEIIFASSRPGGLGEHDLYCARFTDPRSEAEREDENKRAAIRGSTTDPRVWSKPVLLRELSSPRDEYRPMVFERQGTRYLVFSSTREGGKGGYDLYIVGYKGCPRA
jgi:hypothetical protein